MSDIKHSWGNTPKQKAAEKRYNAEYYRRNKEKWLKYRENAQSREDQYKKNIEGAKKRYDMFNKEYLDLKYKYDKLSKQYQKFLQGASQVGINDSEMIRQRNAYLKELENTAMQMGKVEDNKNHAKENLDAQIKKATTDRENYERTIAKDPFAARSKRRANAYAENEKAKAEAFTTRAERIKNRAEAYGANEAAKQKAVKDASDKRKQQKAERLKKVNEELFIANQRINDIKARMDKNTKALQAAPNKHNEYAKMLAENIQNDAEKLRSMKDKVKELETEKSKLS